MNAPSQKYVTNWIPSTADVYAQFKINTRDLELCSLQAPSRLKSDPVHPLLGKRVMVKHSPRKGYAGRIKDVGHMEVTVELDSEQARRFNFTSGAILWTCRVPLSSNSKYTDWLYTGRQTLRTLCLSRSSRTHSAAIPQCTGPGTDPRTHWVALDILLRNPSHIVEGLYPIPHQGNSGFR